MFSSPNILHHTELVTQARHVPETEGQLPASQALNFRLKVPTRNHREQAKMPQALYRSIQPMFKTNRWRICRDDLVYILSGPDKGKTGKVLEIIKDTRTPQVIVEGRNLVRVAS